MGAIRNKRFGIACLTFQVIFVVLFAVFIDYDSSAHANPHHDDTPEPEVDEADDQPHRRETADPKSEAPNMLWDYYPMFQDVHVMMFIGFGFLMMFLKRYGFSSVGLNFLIGAFVIQWAIIFSQIIHMVETGTIKGYVNIHSLLTADFAAATVFISFGALLGKTSPLQMLVLAFVEIIVFSINEWVGVSIFKAVDIGGSMFVHAFGAYFGLSASCVLFQDAARRSDKEGSVYHSDMFSMLGTVFLWIFWPSFNSALGVGDAQHRAVINTYLALAACCVVVFAISSLSDKHGKFDMVHIQNATLAGGVAVGTSADMMIRPWGAILIGMVAGTLSVIGFKYVTPCLSGRLKVHDTCGVNNLHGMPAIFAGIAAAVAAAVATTKDYGMTLYTIFPARTPLDNTTALWALQEEDPWLTAGIGRTAGEQAGFQALALVVTVAIACVAGGLTGLLLRVPGLDAPGVSGLYDDSPLWAMPDDFPPDTAAKPQPLLGHGNQEAEPTV